MLTASWKINALGWTRDRLPITRSKLAYEVAKKLKRYLDSMAVRSHPDGISLTLLLKTELQNYPINGSTDKRWKIGEGSMCLSNMFLVRLESVSKGSFQPDIWVEDVSTPLVRPGPE